MSARTRTHTHPLTVGARLQEDDCGLAVPTLHREVERRVTRAVSSVEAGLGPSLRRVEEDVQERPVAGRRGAVEGVLVGAVTSVDLYVSDSQGRAAPWVRTSAPRVMRRRPICVSAALAGKRTGTLPLDAA